MAKELGGVTSEYDDTDLEGFNESLETVMDEYFLDDVYGA
eukprot:CAMPEP_0176339764 /NCGR_PEP_ID=MMETSP0126-20121128/1040_1 /TAXON_ID=141414 ORGANISM="Strombidinopsis acuminatum, Strain SPMC142" /NCGR_SAMPLE_ID=MMETSP0126 /ASSEMBLY_ACC=CAM_ASM_000229 /LENGTH=39 /DNA_ID= /DNA_START= /DNA_END= /DNA_ORIENTATION=